MTSLAVDWGRKRRISPLPPPEWTGVVRPFEASWVPGFPALVHPKDQGLKVESTPDIFCS